MTDTTISDAVAFPQDEGTGVPDGSEDYDSAAYFGLLARNADGEYVDNGLDFKNVDTTNERVDVGAGHAFIEADQTTVSVQSGSQTTYDTDLPSGTNMTYVVVLPTDETALSLATDTDNDVWLFIDPTANDAVKIRHGNGLSSPESDGTPKPAIKLGTVNTSTGATTRASDDKPLRAVGDVQAQSPIDLNGNALKDDSRGFVEIGSSDDLRLGTGQSIEDGGGVNRLTFPSTQTRVHNDVGDAILTSADGFDTSLVARSGTPVRIRDAEGAFDAVQYDTDATAGVLRTPNAGFRVEGNPAVSTGEGILLEYLPGSNKGNIVAFDWDTTTFKTIEFQGSLYDFSGNAADLRLATGKAIEDGSGTATFEINSFGNSLNNPNGDRIFLARSLTSQAGGPEIHVPSGKNLELVDDEGSFDAIKYITSASAPGTLELSNANLDIAGNAITDSVNGNINFNNMKVQNVEHVLWDPAGDQPVPTEHGIIWHSDGSGSFGNGDMVIGSDVSGSSKTAVLFDYSAGSVSSERYKKDVRSLEADPYGILDVEAVTYTSRDANEVTAHGFIAEDLHDWNPDAVRTNTLTEDWAHDEYTEKYGYEVGDEVPNQPRKWPVLAAHHEILRDLVTRVEQLEAAA